MNFYKKIAFVLIIFMSTFVWSKSMSLQIIQKNGSENVVFDASYLVEQTIMDYFFEHAYIVSNSPVIIQKKSESIKSELQKSYDSAQEGYLDFIIEVTILYNLSDSNNPEEALLNNIEKIEWNVKSLSDKSLISSGNAIPNSNRNDEDSIIYFASEIAKNIENEIKAKGGLK